MANELQTGASHPAVKFRDVPMIEGPLSGFEAVRPRVLDDVIRRTEEELGSANLDLLIGEALYQERTRLRRSRANLFTRARHQRDAKLWHGVQAGLLQPSGTRDRRELLREVLRHYAEEIGGHFDPRIYRFAVGAVPFGFSWLLNAASSRQFNPWKLTQSLERNLTITGEIDQLQRLARKGTILMVPTHQSNIDSVLIGYIIYLMSLPPFAYGAGLNLFSNPVLSFFMSNLGAYTVDRQKSNAIYKEILKNYSTRILREGVHSIFFPGGGRARSGAIESKVKLGLLGTALEAQIGNLAENRPNPGVYVVPMVMSYNFVLEASSLIEDFLAAEGRHRYIIMDDESWQPVKVAKFFWKFFSAQSRVSVRIGRAMDVFGNFVDDEGCSLGPNGTTIDPRRWLTTRGELRADAARDREYTRVLGNRIVERFHRENTVLPSHLAAFAFFELLRRQYPDLDVYRLLRLSLPQRTVAEDAFRRELDRQHERVREAAGRGMFHLSPELAHSGPDAWLADAVRELGVFHENRVLALENGLAFTEDMPLLYYYRNRLAGYGLSLLSDPLRRLPGQYDAKGFLA
jgi:glycerol-3-phosphate O-acyltransferase